MGYVSNRSVVGSLVALIVIFILSGCMSGPEVVRNLPAGAGTDFYVQAPARQVFERLPEAVRLSDLDMESVDLKGPPKWEAIAQVGMSIGSDGQWMRITVEETTPELSHVTVVSRLKGGGIMGSTDTPRRNLLLHTLLLNSPQVKTMPQDPIKRPDRHTDLVRFQNLARDAMAPLSKREWTGDTIGSNAALLASIEGRGVLIGYTTMKKIGKNPHARVPRITCIALHDFRTGNLIWKRDEIDLGSSVSLVTIEPGLVLLTSGSLRSFDLSTGKDLWSVGVSAISFAVDETGRHAVLWTVEKKEKDKKEKTVEKQVLTAVALGDGKARWTTPISDSVANRTSQVFVKDGRVLAIGGRAVLYNLDTGKMAAEFSPLSTPPIRQLFLEDRLILGDNAGTLICAGFDGSIVWKTVLPGRIDHLASDGENLLVVTPARSKINLHFLSLQSGDKLWTREGNPLAGNPVLTAKFIAYSTQQNLVILDRASGARIAVAPRSLAMRLAELPDRLLVFDDQVTAVGETGLMAVSTGGKRKPGDVLWQIDVRGEDLSSLAARQNQVSRAGYAYATQEARATMQEAGKVVADIRRSQQTPSSYMFLAQQQADHAQKMKWLSESHGSSSSGNPYKGFSEGQKIQLMQAEINRGKRIASDQLSAAITGFSLSMALNVLANIELGIAEYSYAHNVRCEAALERATELWLLSVQDGHFVRPIGWEFGEGVLVVDPRTGYWMEIITGPGEPLVHNFYPQYPPAIISPTGTQLFTLANNGKPGLDEFPLFTVAGRGATAYGLSDKTAWHPPEVYQQKSLAPRPISELRAAAKKK